MTAPSPLDAEVSQLAFAVAVEGQVIDSTYQVVSIDTWVSANKVPRAQIVLFDGSAPEADFPISDETTFVPGAKVDITAGYGDAKTKIFGGLIVKHGIEITGAQGSKLCVDLADEAIKMTLARKNAAFEKITDGDLIGKLIDASGLAKDVAATTTQHEKIVQFYATDWDLMLTRAEANGLLVMVADGKVTVAAPEVAESGVLGVKYGVSILDLQAEMDASDQYSSDAIKSYAWDSSTQALLDAGPAAASLTEAGNLSSADLATKLDVSSYPQQSGAALTQEELADWSSAMLLRSKLAKIRGHVRFQGSALAQVGKTLELAGLGDRFNGNVLIGGVHHGIRDGRWLTTVTFGLPPRPFATTAPRIAAPDASGLLPPIKGLQTGIVKQVAVDEAGEFRVLVTLPLLQEETGVWARLATFYASNAVGAVFYPEIKDEVVVGFMNEDPRYPVILGSVYSKAQPPPDDATPDEKNTTKAIVTEKKLKIVLCDKDKPSIVISTPGGHSIKMDDDAGSITLTDSNGNTVTLAKGGVTVDSPKDINITAKGNISIQATGNLALSATGDASMKGANVAHQANMKFSANGAAEAELTASGVLTIQGTLVKIN